MRKYLHNVNVPLSTLRKLPPGGEVTVAEQIKDMNGTDRDALIVVWVDKTGVRKAHFAIENGEYLGECCT